MHMCTCVRVLAHVRHHTNGGGGGKREPTSRVCWVQRGSAAVLCLREGAARFSVPGAGGTAEGARWDRWKRKTLFMDHYSCHRKGSLGKTNRVFPKKLKANMNSVIAENLNVEHCLNFQERVT